LQQLGILLQDTQNKTPQYNSATHETNVPDIYLAGVICGGMDTHSLFIENSREHAVKIMQHIIDKNG
jgi:thioredoxin reductase (NADPH)